MFLNILISLAIMSFIVIIHELGHYFVGRFYKVDIQEFSVGFGPRILSYKDSRNTTWSIKIIPIGGYVAFPESEQGSGLQNISVFGRIFLALGGPLGNIVFALVVSFAFFQFKGVPQIVNKNPIVNVSHKEDLSKDRVEFDQKKRVVNASQPGQKLSYVLVKNNSFFSNLKLSFSVVYKISSLQLKGLINTIFNLKLENMSGPLGIFKITSKKHDLYTSVMLWVTISIALATVNLLPLPPLDGGRVASELIGMFSKKLSEIYINVGSYIFLILIALIMFKDVQSLKMFDCKNCPKCKKVATTEKV